MNPENSMNGFVLLSRSIIKSKVFQKESWLKFCIWCLVKANYKDGVAEIDTGKGTTIINVKRGQFVFGRHTASKELNMPPSTCRNLLQVMRNMGFLDTQKDSHYTLVTVINYDTYQDFDTYRGQAKGQAKDKLRTHTIQDKTNNRLEKLKQKTEKELYG